MWSVISSHQTGRKEERRRPPRQTSHQSSLAASIPSKSSSRPRVAARNHRQADTDGAGLEMGTGAAVEQERNFGNLEKAGDGRWRVGIRRRRTPSHPIPKRKLKKRKNLNPYTNFARECIFKKKLLEKCMGPHHLFIPPPFPSLAEIEH